LGVLVSLPLIVQAEDAAAPESGKTSQQTAPAPAPSANSINDILNLDITQLGQVSVKSTVQPTNLSAPSTQLNVAAADIGEANSIGELLRQVPSVNTRRLSGINFDPQVRGYNSSQLNATANGMNQLKTRVDIDSLFSQIDPGIVRDITVIDGPYTSLYGPGFAFLSADLMSPPRFSTPQTHFSTNFVYGTNGQSLYSRDNVVTGAQNWGVFCSYGLREANDYQTGGVSGQSFTAPSSYQKWDGMFSVSRDLNDYSRIEFDYLRTDMNNVDLPGVVYDLNSSVNNQFNIRYIIQEDRKGPQQLLVQAWHQETFYDGDSNRLSKQETFYQDFISEIYASWRGPARVPVTTVGDGYVTSTGIRTLRTFGDTDAPQWTVGADWRRYDQRYQEANLNIFGESAYHNRFTGAGLYYGIPQSRMEDFGVLTDLQLPANDDVTFTFGGRFDVAKATVNANDVVANDASVNDGYYFYPGTDMPTYDLGMVYALAKWKLNEHDTLNVGTSFAMRAPELSELYSNDPYVPYCGFGNSAIEGLSNLSPEKNWQFDLGLQSEHGPFCYGARGFYATIQDYILAVPYYTRDPYDTTHYLGRDFGYFPADQRWDITDPAINGDTISAGYQTTNIGLATLAGGDLFGEVEIRKGITCFGCMSYVHGKNLRRVQFAANPTGDSRDGTFVPISGSESLPNMYPFNGRLSLRVFDPDKDQWGTEVVARFVHTQDEVAVSLSELPSPGFSVFDIRGYYRLRKNIRLNAEVQNLFNRYYFEPGSLVIMGPNGIPTRLPEPGVNFLVSVEARF
jgi:outer membrane receptor protein involved in Fe transport